MASTNVVIASASTTTNSELPRQSSICSLSTFIADFQHHHPTDDDGEEQSAASGALASSVSAMDDLLKNIYSDSPQPPQQSQHHPPSESPFPAAGVDEVWKRIVAGGTDQRLEADDGGGAMTLEDFLTKNGAVREEDVRVPVGGYGHGPGPGPGQFQAASMTVYGNGSGSAAPARGKRRAIEEPLDKATQQKQRRMIKNRESAARSRERKQAYTVELEALVTQLEEENSRLLREQAEQKKERFKQLMEKLVPVVEKMEKKEKGEKEIVENFALNVEKTRTRTRTRTRTPGVLRRVYSAKW